MQDLLIKARELITAIRNNEATEDLTKGLAGYDREELQDQLFDDSLKKAFWINIYNAYYQILRNEFENGT